MSKVDGEMSQTSDQSSDSNVVSAMMRNLKFRLPLVLIVGSYSPTLGLVLPPRGGLDDHDRSAG